MSSTISTELVPPLRFQTLLDRLHNEHTIPSPPNFTLPPFDTNILYELKNWQTSLKTTFYRHEVSPNRKTPDDWYPDHAIESDNFTDPFALLATVFTHNLNAVELYHHSTVVDLRTANDWNPIMADLTLLTSHNGTYTQSASSPSFIYLKDAPSELELSAKHLLGAYANAATGYPGPNIEAYSPCDEHLNPDPRYRFSNAHHPYQTRNAFDLLRTISAIIQDGSGTDSVGTLKYSDCRDIYADLKRFLTPSGRESRVDLGGQLVYSRYSIPDMPTPNYNMYQLYNVVAELINHHNAEFLGVLESAVGGYLELLNEYIHPSYQTIASYVMSTWVYGASLNTPMLAKNLSTTQT